MTSTTTDHPDVRRVISDWHRSFAGIWTAWSRHTLTGS